MREEEPQETQAFSSMEVSGGGVFSWSLGLPQVFFYL